MKNAKGVESRLKKLAQSIIGDDPRINVSWISYRWDESMRENGYQIDLYIGLHGFAFSGRGKYPVNLGRSEKKAAAALIQYLKEMKSYADSLSALPVERLRQMAEDEGRRIARWGEVG